MKKSLIPLLLALLVPTLLGGSDLLPRLQRFPLALLMGLFGMIVLCWCINALRLRLLLGFAVKALILMDWSTPEEHTRQVGMRRHQQRICVGNLHRRITRLPVVAIQIPLGVKRTFRDIREDGFLRLFPLRVTFRIFRHGDLDAGRELGDKPRMQRGVFRNSASDGH